MNSHRCVFASMQSDSAFRLQSRGAAGLLHLPTLSHTGHKLSDQKSSELYVTVIIYIYKNGLKYHLERIRSPLLTCKYLTSVCFCSVFKESVRQWSVQDDGERRRLRLGGEPQCCHTQHPIYQIPAQWPPTALYPLRDLCSQVCFFFLLTFSSVT